jgi:alpha-tubulin suppressor-like RCC1 family protein
MQVILRRIAAPVVLLAVSALAACVSAPPFVCKSNPDCVSEQGSPGICETIGSCSFYDSTCPTTMRRFADGASESLSSTCVPAGAQCIDQLAMGNSHSCALRSDGAVLCWGLNDRGQVGDGTTVDAATPVLVKGLPSGHRAVQIATGNTDTCTLLDDHTVWCWGAGDLRLLGQCGGGADSDVAVEVPTWTPNPLDPAAAACDPGTPFTATQIAIGGGHACAIGTDGRVYCWGENQTGAQGGQCGQDPAIFDDVPGPLAVAFEGAIQVGCGDEYTCVIKDENSVWCFGGNDLDELGNGTKQASFVPVNVVGISDAKSLALDDETPCIVTTSGALFCWGNGTTGIFGEDLNHNVPAATRVTTCNQAYGSGASETMCVTQTDGTLECFGANDMGQCGAATQSPNLTSPTPTLLITVTRVGLGGDHSCAVTTDGALWCWGADDYGQLGDGQHSPIPNNVPERIDFPCP